MDILTICDIHMPATIIGAVLVFVFGWFWYSDFAFCKSYREAQGLGEMTGSPVPALIVEAIYTALLAWLVAIFYMLQFDKNMLVGIGPIFGGLVITGLLAGNMWQQKPAKVSAIDIGHFIGSIIILIAVQYIFRMML